MTSLTWERRQSRSPVPYESLDWPATDPTIAHVDVYQGEPQEHLVSADDAPSFINFYTAAACFFWLDRQPVGGSLHQGVMYRHQDSRGRVNGVRILDEEVEVEVEGERRHWRDDRGVGWRRTGTCSSAPRPSRSVRRDGEIPGQGRASSWRLGTLAIRRRVRAHPNRWRCDVLRGLATLPGERSPSAVSSGNIRRGDVTWPALGST